MCRTRKIAIFALLLSGLAVALPNVSNEKIVITSDSSTYNYSTGTNSYEGNVKVDQGTTHLTSDRLVTKINAHHKIEQIIAIGTKQLAEYVSIPKPGDPVFKAKAKSITFFPSQSTVILEGDVVVTQGENSFHGPLMIYNMKDQLVTAPASHMGRATITINAKQLSL